MNITLRENVTGALYLAKVLPMYMEDHPNYSGAVKKLEMPRKIVEKQCSSQESLASTHRYVGYSNQIYTRGDISKIAAEKRCNEQTNLEKFIFLPNDFRKKICETCSKKRSSYKLKRSKIKKGSNNNVEVGPMEYIFYSVLNTNYNMDQGTAAAAIARSFMVLHKKLDTDYKMGYYIDKWTRSGEKIIILEGFDRKHLKYLYDETKYAAIDRHALHRRWSSGRDIIVLTVFGQQYDLQDVFEGLLPLR